MVIHKQNYFDQHNLLCKSHSGFRRMHSTEAAVTYFANEILMNMDKGLVTGSVTWQRLSTQLAMTFCLAE